MKRSKLSRYIFIVSMIALAQSLFFLVPTSVSAAQNPSYVMPDSVFVNIGSMTEQQIQDFLVARGSYLATYTMPAAFYFDPTGENRYNDTWIGEYGKEVDSTGWLASKVIYNAAQWYGLNPQVILATLFKEQTWVTSTDTLPSGDLARRLRWAMGYAVTEGGVVSVCKTGNGSNPTGSCAGFAMQVDWAAANLMGNYNGSANKSAKVSPYWAGNSINLDGVSVYLGNNSTAALYRYTPHSPYSYNYVWFFNAYFTNIDWVDPGLKVYRFWNTNGTHFYTASESEKNSVIAKWPNIYKLEGVAYSLDTTNPLNSVPLYRFYNTSNGTHFYTATEAEKNNILQKWGYIYQLDGVAYNVSTMVGGTPVYRFWNANGTHFYTASEAEKDNIVAKWPTTFKLEGIAYYIY